MSKWLVGLRQGSHQASMHKDRLSFLTYWLTADEARDLAQQLLKAAEALNRADKALGKVADG